MKLDKSIIDLALVQMGFVKEYQFSPPRKFRFDYCNVDKKLAIEYEGLVATNKKGGHQTKIGYSSNCEKYNLAVKQGWRVLRYTALNFQDVFKDLEEL